MARLRLIQRAAWIAASGVLAGILLSVDGRSLESASFVLAIAAVAIPHLAFLSGFAEKTLDIRDELHSLAQDSKIREAELTKLFDDYQQLMEAVKTARKGDPKALDKLIRSHNKPMLQ